MGSSFRLLGSAKMIVDSRTIPLPSTKQNVVLVTLLLHANDPVSLSRLFEALWGDEPPSTALATLQTYIFRLRQFFLRHDTKANLLHTVPGGYSIDASAETLDVISFRRLVIQAGRCADISDTEGELKHLAEATSLWHGPVLTNVQSEVLHREEVPRLVEGWLDATERRIDVELMLGRHSRTTPELRSLTGAYPLRECFWAQLVEVLYRSGRRAEALAEYRKIKQILLDDLGIDPNPRLQLLELQMLRGEVLPLTAGGDAAPPVTAVPVARASVFCQLPPRAPNLVGRGEVTARLVQELRADRDHSGPAMVLLRGPPGVGKSALALHVAHQVRREFPDGQWYVQLAGRPDGTPRPTADVLVELLHAAGIDPRSLPESGATRAAALRASVADRRMLLLLEDASSLEQVQPLLPGTSGNAVLITSPTNLLGLTALHGARSHILRPLDPRECLEVLGELLGSTRVQAEPQSALELAGLCDRLPLALRIVATKLAGRPERRLVDEVRWLRTDTLTKLSLRPNSPVSVRGSFDSSLGHLSAGARESFRRIGRELAPRFSTGEVLRLIGGPAAILETLVEELVDASLLESTGPDQYLVPGLLRVYAMELVPPLATP